MADVIFIALVAGFFGLMILLVKACDHIIGPDTTSTQVAPPDPDEVDEQGDVESTATVGSDRP